MGMIVSIGCCGGSPVLKCPVFMELVDEHGDGVELLSMTMKDVMGCCGGSPVLKTLNLGFKMSSSLIEWVLSIISMFASTSISKGSSVTTDTTKLSRYF